MQYRPLITCGGAEDTHREPHEYIAQMNDGGISQKPLEIILAEIGQNRHEHGKESHCSHKAPYAHGEIEAGEEHSRDEIDAGLHHGGGVQICADGGGGFHCIRQPGVKRDLGGFCPCRHQQQDEGGALQGRGQPAQGCKAERAGEYEAQQ